jgi:integrase
MGPASGPPVEQGQSIENGRRRGIVRYLKTDEHQRLRAALLRRDATRTAERESANRWRAERGYPTWPAHGVYTDHLTPLVLMALNTGLRRGELFQLRWSDVDLQTAQVTVGGESAKSGQTRYLPLNTDILKVLLAWRPTDVTLPAFVFPGRQCGHPLDDIKTSWAALLKSATIDGFRFHDCRHDFASKLVMAGVDLNTVRELLGHSDIKMVLRYAHLAPEHTAAAVEKLVAV